METTTPSLNCRASRVLQSAFGVALLSASLFGLSAASTHAASATWDLNPVNGDWNTASNWTPATIPNGSSDAATFAVSDTTRVSISAVTEVNNIAFDAGASAFTITVYPSTTLAISGVGITNNSGITQHFVASLQGGTISFTHSAAAGSLTAFTNNGATSGGGSTTGATYFFDTSTASNGTFTNNGGTGDGAPGGTTGFFDSSTAGNGTFTNNGGGFIYAGGGVIEFTDTSTAGNGTFINNGAAPSYAGGGMIEFTGTSTAGSATLIANDGTDGGKIYFFDSSRGGTARVEVFGDGSLDIGHHVPPGVTVGSIEGDGDVFLGAKNLTVGSNNLKACW